MSPIQCRLYRRQSKRRNRCLKPQEVEPNGLGLKKSGLEEGYVSGMTLRVKDEPYRIPLRGSTV